MSITIYTLSCRQGGSTYSYYLHTNKVTTPAICVRKNGGTYYVPLSTGSSKLHVRYNNTNYGAQSWTPQINFQIYATSSTVAYAQHWSVQIRNITMSNNVSVGGGYRLYVKVRAYAGSNYSSWYTMATLNAGATSASNNSISFSFPGGNLQYGIYLENQLMTSGSVSTGGWRSFSYAIPFYYWSGSWEK